MDLVLILAFLFFLKQYCLVKRVSVGHNPQFDVDRFDAGFSAIECDTKARSILSTVSSFLYYALSGMVAAITRYRYGSCRHNFAPTPRLCCAIRDPGPGMRGHNVQKGIKSLPLRRSDMKVTIVPLNAYLNQRPWCLL